MLWHAAGVQGAWCMVGRAHGHASVLVRACSPAAMGAVAGSWPCAHAAEPLPSPFPAAQADKTARKAQMADRLISGLSGENKRWGEEIKRLEVLEGKLVGDVLIASAFVSYAGPFNMQFRVSLVSEKWMPDMIERQIPMTPGIMPLDILTDDATTAKWNNEGLPTDPLSIENGAIMTNAARWSLMIDPQLQGIRWIINKEEANGLVIIQQSQHKYIDKVTYCIENGLPLLIENLPVDIDAVLDPVIGKLTMKKGRNLIMKIGDNEVRLWGGTPWQRAGLQCKCNRSSTSTAH